MASRSSHRLVISVLCALSLLIAAQNFASVAHVDTTQPEPQSPLPPAAAAQQPLASGAAPSPPPCAADNLLRHPRAAASGERYLLYAPQFGLSNQLVALRNAVVWALLLNRTLVLPHLLGHGTASSMAAHGAAFAVRPAALKPLRVIEMDDFLRLGLRPQRLRVLDIAAKFATQSEELAAAAEARYSGDIGVTLGVTLALTLALILGERA